MGGIGLSTINYGVVAIAPELARGGAEQLSHQSAFHLIWIRWKRSGFQTESIFFT